MSVKCILTNQTPELLTEHIQDKNNPHEITLQQIGAASNPNLLDNWYFANPINQMGQTEYTGGGYTIDRWRIDIDGGNGITIEDGCINIKSVGTYIGQYTDEFVRWRGRKLTGSALLNDGTLLSGTIDFVGNLNQAQMFFADNRLGFYIQAVSESLAQIELNSVQNDVKIVAVKMELGAVQTLAHQENGVWVLNEIPKYTEQIAICSQYNPTTGERIGGLVSSAIPMSFSINESGGLRITY